jgi:hypothetical protein
MHPRAVPIHEKGCSMRKFIAGTFATLALAGGAMAPVAQAADQSTGDHSTTAPSSYGKA